MSFFKTDVSEEANKEQSGEGQYLSRSGIYDVIIKTASVQTNDKGANSINFNVNYNDTPAILYGLKLDNNDGTPNYQRAIFNKLMVILGIQSLEDPTPETHKLGKDNKETELMVLTELSDMPCKVRVQEEYSRIAEGFPGAGGIRKSLTIRNFYRSEDGATAEEIIKDASGDEVKFGSTMTKDKTYAENITYRESVKGAGDAPTPEEVTAWYVAKKTVDTPTAPKATTTKKPMGNLFAPKK